VFVQTTEAQEPKVATIKKIFMKNIKTARKGQTLTLMGSIIANGIINAAGRNATISLTTRDGNVRHNAITGMVLFLQYWFWYPMLNFLTLTLTPNSLIALNKDLKVPKSFEIKLNAKPSLFDYPEFLKKDSDKKKEKIETAVLSTTAKVKARE
jgi:26S proteasome regulatory subunit N2